jgi:hypothetical protein
MLQNWALAFCSGIEIQKTNFVSHKGVWILQQFSKVNRGKSEFQCHNWMVNKYFAPFD